MNGVHCSVKLKRMQESVVIKQQTFVLYQIFSIVMLPCVSWLISIMF